MEEEILADFFDWKGKHSLIRLSVLVIKTNPAGICTIIPNSSFLIPHSILICRGATNQNLPMYPHPKVIP